MNLNNYSGQYASVSHGLSIQPEVPLPDVENYEEESHYTITHSVTRCQEQTLDFH